MRLRRTRDPRHHLRHYRGKMLQYWEYEEFIIHSFQDSLTGPALDWFMTLKAEDIPTWADLSSKFVDQYQFCAEAPPTLLELSTKEMAEARKKLDMWIKLGRIEDPNRKREGDSSRRNIAGSPAGNKKGKETTINVVSPGHQESRPVSMNYAPVPSATQAYGPPPAHYPQQPFSAPPAPHDYVPGAGLGANGQGITHPIEIEDNKNRRGLGYRPSCHEVVQARNGKHLHHLAAHYGRINRGIPIPPLSYFFPGPPCIVGGTLQDSYSDSDDASIDELAIYAVSEETPPGVHIRPARENEHLNNWTSVPRYSAVFADV
ncbi:hypothetical protein CRG98_026816 [Punica granatum]|uniref:G-patch domain-containing protein n=1 Tax=Punica granatum TaxID=22663 RepID=A0A2I0J950_PUNGR|nr:hypothetical protein CRG98_026816 [Punica granatum]